MAKKVFAHILILLSAVFLTFIWVTDNFLTNYSLQLTAILLLTLLAAHHLHKPSQFRLVESTVSTICVLLITNTTGGAASPLFFLNIILLFELSLLLEPPVPLALTAGLVIFYIYTHNVGSSLVSLVGLISLPFMTPLAYLFGKIYKKEENQKREIRNLHNQLRKLKDDILTGEWNLDQLS